MNRTTEWDSTALLLTHCIAAIFLLSETQNNKKLELLRLRSEPVGDTDLLLFAGQRLLSALEFLFEALKLGRGVLQQLLLRHRHAVLHFDFAQQLSDLPLQLLDDAVSLKPKEALSGQ